VPLAPRSSSTLTASPYLSAYQYFSDQGQTPKALARGLLFLLGDRERLRNGERFRKGKNYGRRDFMG
ncbi:MAG TPA: hypothetical protein VGC99_09135, partial [Candidatus Tectomicrobia bacterium]